ncbi:MAG: hypothetical protein MAG451_02454 [Anaerolineales bacterium]|nr:hypothetical protein [Anaerolineales bacterium]
MTSVRSSVLEETVNRLVQGLHPERIYLFGSQARGQAGETSDFDLLVVLPESDLPRHRREAISYDLLWGMAAPIDVIVLTQSEFEQGRRVKTSLASTVQKEGELLYG